MHGGPVLRAACVLVASSPGKMYLPSLHTRFTSQLTSSQLKCKRQPAASLHYGCLQLLQLWRQVVWSHSSPVAKELLS